MSRKAGRLSPSTSLHPIQCQDGKARRNPRRAVGDVEVEVAFAEDFGCNASQTIDT